MNIQSNNSYTTNFKAIELCSGSKDVIGKMLKHKPKDLIAIDQLIKEQYSNSVDIYLFGNGTKKLTSKIIPNTTFLKEEKINQGGILHPFESIVDFIKRSCRLANQMERAKANMPIDEATKVSEKYGF